MELFSLVYPVIQKNISLLFRLRSMKNTKSIKMRDYWCAWALYNLSFLRMEKQRFRTSAALNLATHNISLTQDVIACRIPAAVDVISCRISAALDVKACRILAALDVKACRISATIYVKACRISSTLDVRPCRISALQFVISYQIKLKRKTA